MPVAALRGKRIGDLRPVMTGGRIHGSLSPWLGHLGQRDHLDLQARWLLHTLLPFTWNDALLKPRVQTSLHALWAGLGLLIAGTWPCLFGTSIMGMVWSGGISMKLHEHD